MSNKLSEQPIYNYLLEKDNFEFSKYKTGPDIQHRIYLLCQDDEEILQHVQQAVYYSFHYQDKPAWITSIRLHNDLTGKFDIMIKATSQDVPDITNLKPGRYRIMIKYFNPHLTKKGGNKGAITTINKDIYINPENSNFISPEGLTREKANQPAPDPHHGLPDFNNIDKLNAQITSAYSRLYELMSQTITTQIKTLTDRENIESEAFKKGLESGKTAALLEIEKEKTRDLLNQLQNNTAQGPGGQDMENLISGILSGKMEITDILKMLPQNILEKVKENIK